MKVKEKASTSPCQVCRKKLCLAHTGIAQDSPLAATAKFLELFDFKKEGTKTITINSFKPHTHTQEKSVCSKVKNENTSSLIKNGA